MQICDACGANQPLTLLDGEWQREGFYEVCDSCLDEINKFIRQTQKAFIKQMKDDQHAELDTWLSQKKSTL